MGRRAIKRAVRRIVENTSKKLGYEITRFAKTDWGTRCQIIRNNNIKLVLDVGANIGQYAEMLRSNGYNEKIISFEPMTQEYTILSRKAMNDPLWKIYNLALGSSVGQAEINVAGNSISSSILPMNHRHLKSAPKSAYLDKEYINLSTLDVLAGQIFSNDNVMMKIDVQGYEQEVLNGAKSCLGKIKLIELELSLVTLYDNQPLYLEMINFMDSVGYDLIFIERGFTDSQTGRMLQMNGIFLKR